MSKVTKNTILQGFSGSVGDLVIRQMPDGSIRVSRKPDFSRRKFSQRQKDQQDRLKQAAAYARVAAKTQPIYAELARARTRTPITWRSRTGSARPPSITSNGEAARSGYLPTTTSG